jgi:hypothetical protein
MKVRCIDAAYSGDKLEHGAVYTVIGKNTRHGKVKWLLAENDSRIGFYPSRFVAIEDAETDDALDCRKYAYDKARRTLVPVTPAAPLTPAQAGIQRALRRLCDGADYRSGCADYEPER